MFGRAVKITMGITMAATTMPIAIFMRNGSASLAAATAAPYTPDAAAA